MIDFDLDLIKTSKEQIYTNATFRVRADVVEITKHITGYTLVAVPFLLMDEPYYISIFIKNSSIENNEVTRLILKDTIPYMSIDIEAKIDTSRSLVPWCYTYLEFIRFINPPSMETVNYVQYCTSCNSFIFAVDESNVHQCCADCDQTTLFISRCPLKYYNKKHNLSYEQKYYEGDNEDMDNKFATISIENSEAISKAQALIDKVKKNGGSVGSLSDGYHTFDELYHHRALLFASLCMTTFRNVAWKSLLHDDPKNNPMYAGMFIVGVETPDGQATYHYDIDPYWSIFKVKELDHAPKYDGHTPTEAIERILHLAESFNVPNPRFPTSSETTKRDFSSQTTAF